MIGIGATHSQEPGILGKIARSIRCAWRRSSVFSTSVNDRLHSLVVLSGGSVKHFWQDDDVTALKAEYDHLAEVYPEHIDVMNKMIELWEYRANALVTCQSGFIKAPKYALGSEEEKAIYESLSELITVKSTEVLNKEDLKAARCFQQSMQQLQGVLGKLNMSYSPNAEASQADNSYKDIVEMGVTTQVDNSRVTIHGIFAERTLQRGQVAVETKPSIVKLDDQVEEKALEKLDSMLVFERPQFCGSEDELSESENELDVAQAQRYLDGCSTRLTQFIRDISEYNEAQRTEAFSKELNKIVDELTNNTLLGVMNREYVQHRLVEALKGFTDSQAKIFEGAAEKISSELDHLREQLNLFNDREAYLGELNQNYQDHINYANELLGIADDGGDLSSIGPLTNPLNIQTLQQDDEMDQYLPNGDEVEKLGQLFRQLYNTILYPLEESVGYYTVKEFLENGETYERGIKERGSVRYILDRRIEIAKQVMQAAERKRDEKTEELKKVRSRKISSIANGQNGEDEQLSINQIEDEVRVCQEDAETFAGEFSRLQQDCDQLNERLNAIRELVTEYQQGYEELMQTSSLQLDDVTANISSLSNSIDVSKQTLAASKKRKQDYEKVHNLSRVIRTNGDSYMYAEGSRLRPKVARLGGQFLGSEFDSDEDEAKVDG